MCNHIILIFLLIISVSAQAIEQSSWWRFHRLLREYDNPIYRASDKDVFLRAEYSANRKDEHDNEYYYNFGNQYLNQEYNLDFNGSIGAKGQWISSKSYLQSDHKLTIDISGMIDKNNTIRTNKTTGTYDSSKTLIQTATGKLTYDGTIRRYLFPSRLNRYLFIEAGVNLKTSGEYSRNRSLNHYQREYEVLRSVLTRQSNYSIQSSLFPAIGCGKRLPVKPVYSAFEIERNLRKLKALQSKLADSSMMRLAALYGSLDSFRLSRERPDKFIMSALDSILRSDPALDAANYDAFSLFKVYETLTERFPLLFHGFEIKIRPDFMVSCDYSSRFPVEESPLPEPWNVDFRWSFKNPILFAWTFPVLPRIFIEYSVAPPSLFTEKILHHYSSLKLYYFMTNRILLDFSINDISTFIILPNGNPGHMLFSTIFFLEDKLTLQLSAGKWFRSSQEPLPWSVKMAHERLTLQVGYDF